MQTRRVAKRPRFLFSNEPVSTVLLLKKWDKIEWEPIFDVIAVIPTVYRYSWHEPPSYVLYFLMRGRDGRFYSTHTDLNDTNAESVVAWLMASGLRVGSIEPRSVPVTNIRLPGFPTHKLLVTKDSVRSKHVVIEGTELKHITQVLLRLPQAQLIAKTVLNQISVPIKERYIEQEHAKALLEKLASMKPEKVSKELPKYLPSLLLIMADLLNLPKPTVDKERGVLLFGAPLRDILKIIDLKKTLELEMHTHFFVNTLFIEMAELMGSRRSKWFNALYDNIISRADRDFGGFLDAVAKARSLNELLVTVFLEAVYATNYEMSGTEVKVVGEGLLPEQVAILRVFGCSDKGDVMVCDINELVKELKRMKESLPTTVLRKLRRESGKVITEEGLALSTGDDILKALSAVIGRHIRIVNVIKDKDLLAVKALYRNEPVFVFRKKKKRGAVLVTLLPYEELLQVFTGQTTALEKSKEIGGQILVKAMAHIIKEKKEKPALVKIDEDTRILTRYPNTLRTAHNELRSISDIKAVWLNSRTINGLPADELLLVSKALVGEKLGEKEIEKLKKLLMGKLVRMLAYNEIIRVMKNYWDFSDFSYWVTKGNETFIESVKSFLETLDEPHFLSQHFVPLAEQMVYGLPKSIEELMLAVALSAYLMPNNLIVSGIKGDKVYISVLSLSRETEMFVKAAKLSGCEVVAGAVACKKDVLPDVIEDMTFNSKVTEEEDVVDATIARYGVTDEVADALKKIFEAAFNNGVVTLDADVVTKNVHKLLPALKEVMKYMGDRYSKYFELLDELIYLLEMIENYEVVRVAEQKTSMDI